MRFSARCLSGKTYTASPMSRNGQKRKWLPSPRTASMMAAGRGIELPTQSKFAIRLLLPT